MLTTPPDAPATPPPPGQPFTPPVPGTAEVLPGGGGYAILKFIDKGEYGEVFRALAPGGVEVAVKRIFRPSSHAASQRKLQALELIKSLRHPFLLQTQAYWTEQDRLCIVMELADDSLFDRFKQCQAQGLPGIPREELLAYFVDAAEALDFLHSRQVIHRDIKPTNLLRLQGRAKVADFGLARLFSEKQAPATFCGTPVYMAPEVWKSEYSIHSDQYSLAATFVEMCVGQRISLGLTRDEESGLNIDGFNEAERKVLGKALAVHSDQRFPNCLAFVRALREASAPPPPPPPPPPPRFPFWTFTAPLVLVIVLSTVLIGAVVSGFLQPRRVDLPPETSPKLPPADDSAAHPGIGDSGGGGRPALPKAHPLHGPGGLRSRRVPADTANRPGGPAPVLHDEGQGHQRAVHRRAEGPPHGGPAGGVGRALPGGDPEQVVSPQLCRRTRSLRRRPLRTGCAVGRGRPDRGTKQRCGQAGAGGANKGDHPVLSVTALEASCFAALLGGKLPSGKQWDKAAGRYAGDEGPFKQGWKGPDPDRREATAVGKEPMDESRFGCRGMAANGCEFTTDVSLRTQDGFPAIVRKKARHALVCAGRRSTTMSRSSSKCWRTPWFRRKRSSTGCRVATSGSASRSSRRSGNDV